LANYSVEHLVLIRRDVLVRNLASQESFFLKKEGGQHVQKSGYQHMEVVGSDGKHVGTVDHKEGGDQVMLTKDDPKAGGLHHLISIDWVDYVDRKVHLNKPSQKAMVEWQTVA
jgi:hypothetical protein